MKITIFYTKGKKNKSIWEKTKQDEKTQVDMKFHTSNIENHSFIKKIKIK